MTNDPVNYVRQGALISSALIMIQQTEVTCPKVSLKQTGFIVCSLVHIDYPDFLSISIKQQKNVSQSVKTTKVQNIAVLFCVCVCFFFFS